MQDITFLGKNGFNIPTLVKGKNLNETFTKKFYNFSAIIRLHNINVSAEFFYSMFTGKNFNTN